MALPLKGSSYNSVVVVEIDTKCKGYNDALFKRPFFRYSESDFNKFRLFIVDAPILSFKNKTTKIAKDLTESFIFFFFIYSKQQFQKPIFYSKSPNLCPPGVPRFLIIVISGDYLESPADRGKTVQAAQNVRDSGIEIIVVR